MGGTPSTAYCFEDRRGGREGHESVIVGEACSWERPLAYSQQENEDLWCLTIRN